MQNLLIDFNERVEEINFYYTFLRKINSKSYFLFNKRTKKNDEFEEKIIKILKANTFLLLYNLVEATVDNSIDYLLSEICKCNINYSEITEELKLLWSKVHVKNGLLSKDASALEKNLKLIIDKSIDEYIKFEGDFKPKNRDSIDAQELRLIASRYGFSFNLPKSVQGGIDLKTIKDKRHALAHGGIIFSECGRDYTMEQLTRYKNNTIIVMKKFIQEVEKYVQKKSYQIKLSDKL